MTKSFQAVLLTAVASGAVCAGAGPARAATYLQTNLVSDLSALGAEVMDPNLKILGVSRSNPAGRFGWRIRGLRTRPFMG